MKKLLFLFSCLAFSMAFTQNFNKEKMNEFMNALEQHQKFMGSVAITQNGKMVYERAVGFADTDNQKKNNHRYAIQNRFYYQNLHCNFGDESC